MADQFLQSDTQRELADVHIVDNYWFLSDADHD
jgi:hypothetical protein